MARNAIEGDCLSSEMVVSSHFVTKNKTKKRIDLKWREIESDFRSSNMRGGGGITMASL